eukprot:5212102-Prorocentrum_lima.AAC.1
MNGHPASSPAKEAVTADHKPPSPEDAQRNLAVWACRRMVPFQAHAETKVVFTDLALQFEPPRATQCRHIVDVLAAE